MGEKEVGHDGGFIYQLCFALWNHFYSIFANFFAFLGGGERGEKLVQILASPARLLFESLGANTSGRVHDEKYPLSFSLLKGKL